MKLKWCEGSYIIGYGKPVIGMNSDSVSKTLAETLVEPFSKSDDLQFKCSAMKFKFKCTVTALALIILAWCLLRQIIKAKEKLDARKIATLIREMDSDTVQGCRIILIIYSTQH